MLLRRGRQFLTTAKEYWRPGLAGAAMSMSAYWIVIWAMSVTPMAPVSAVRETSVLFGALLAGFVLKEGRLARFGYDPFDPRLSAQPPFIAWRLMLRGLVGRY